MIVWTASRKNGKKMGTGNTNTNGIAQPLVSHLMHSKTKLIVGGQMLIPNDFISFCEEQKTIKLTWHCMIYIHCIGCEELLSTVTIFYLLCCQKCMKCKTKDGGYTI